MGEGGKNRGTEPEGRTWRGGGPPELGRDFRYPRTVAGSALAVDALRPAPLAARIPSRPTLSTRLPKAR